MCCTTLWTTLGVIAFLIVVTRLAFWFLEPVQVANNSAAAKHEPSHDRYVDVTVPEGSKRRYRKFPSIYSAPSVYLSLVVPAYCEEERLPIMMEQTMKYLEDRRKNNSAFSYEVIIVDDGSKDRTTEVALSLARKYHEAASSSDLIGRSAGEVQQRVKVLTLRTNCGKGGAVRMGMLRGAGKLLLMVDADGATEIADLNKLEEALQGRGGGGGEGVVVGSRAHLQADAVAKRAWYRNVLMHGFHAVVQLLCPSPVQDTQCGFKLFTRGSAARIFPPLHIERWAFDVEILLLAQRLQLSVQEVPVNWEEIAGSKLDLMSSSITMGRDLLLIRLCYQTGVWRTRRSTGPFFVGGVDGKEGGGAGDSAADDAAASPTPSSPLAPTAGARRRTKKEM